MSSVPNEKTCSLAPGRIYPPPIVIAKIAVCVCVCVHVGLSAPDLRVLPGRCEPRVVGSTRVCSVQRRTKRNGIIGCVWGLTDGDEHQLKSTVSASTPSVFATTFLFLRLLPADCIPRQSSSSSRNHNNNSSNDTYGSYSQPPKSEPAQHRKGYGSASPVNANFPQRTRSPSHSLSKGTNGYTAEPQSPTNKALNLGLPASRHRTPTERGTPATSLPSLLNPEPAAPSPAPAAAVTPATTAPSSVSYIIWTSCNPSVPPLRSARTCIRKAARPWFFSISFHHIDPR